MDDVDVADLVEELDIIEEVDMVAVAGVPGLPFVVFGSSSSLSSDSRSISVPPNTSAGELVSSLFAEASLYMSRV